MKGRNSEALHSQFSPGFWYLILLGAYQNEASASNQRGPLAVPDPMGAGAAVVAAT
jgi:hypothetical protein